MSQNSSMSLTFSSVCSRQYHCRRSFLALYSQWQHGSWASKCCLTTDSTMALAFSSGHGHQHGLHLGSRAMDTSMALEAARTTDSNMVLGGSTHHRHPRSPWLQPGPQTLTWSLATVYCPYHFAPTPFATSPAHMALFCHLSC